MRDIVVTQLRHLGLGDILGHDTEKLDGELFEGARGLRAILEKLMLDVMYEIPSATNVQECIVSEEVVAKTKQPILVYQNEAELA